MWLTQKDSVAHLFRKPDQHVEGQLWAQPPGGRGPRPRRATNTFATHHVAQPPRGRGPKPRRATNTFAT